MMSDLLTSMTHGCDDGVRLSRELMSHGLLVKRSAIPLIESVDDLDRLIQDALDKSIRLLDEPTVKESNTMPTAHQGDRPEAGETQTKEIQRGKSRFPSGDLRITRKNHRPQ